MNRYCAICGKCQDHCKCEKPELYRDQMEAGAVRIAKKLGRIEMRSEVESLKDMLSAEQASSRELRRQMDVLAYNYTADERKYKAEIERLQQERQVIQNDQRALTCVFCGHVYPPGTPTANHEALREHVAVCPSHPATQYREEAERLRTELQQWQSYGMARNEQLVEAKAEIERLKRAIGTLQWADDGDGPYCTCCDNDKAQGHKDWCKWMELGLAS
jgi:hypothetical protein